MIVPTVYDVLEVDCPVPGLPGRSHVPGQAIDCRRNLGYLGA